ncbi:MAG: AAA family ATPase [Gammaproteobacteria bacterium]|nr:AAA family ATPase [Gammaproteobacteria bacterium]
MYLKYFGLRELPFTITPDTGFFMNRAGYQDALNVLLIALRSGEGFVKVTGEVGVGKTLLCRKLIKSLDMNYVTAYIYNPYLQPETLLYAIADEINVVYEPDINRHVLEKNITAALQDIHANNKQMILCLDEAQAMPIKTLEVIRLLTNIETEKKKLIQVVLFGQPELDAVLEHPSIRQLKQRITYSYKLLPLNRAALGKYVQHRLVVAGGAGNNLFSHTVLNQLHKASGGVPRLVNILCHKSLLATYGDGSRSVKSRHMQAAIKDTMEAQTVKSRGWFDWLPLFSR